MSWRGQLAAEDVAAIRNMVIATGVFSPEEIEVAEELAQDALTLGVKSHYRFILADMPQRVRHDNNRLAGYSCFGRIPLTDERYDLYWIVTDPAVQQQGIAGELMRRTADAVKALGGKAIYAETSSRAIYAPAQRFYVKSGFSLAATVKDFYSKGDDKLLYCLWL